jgi:NAD(P)-dependent dehydrogenase (short-subunit alcohol dehydrogenase family)
LDSREMAPAGKGWAQMGILDGKTAIVTGAGGGVGRAHARQLAQLGARVIVNDIAGSASSDADQARPLDPAGDVVQEIRDLGGVAEANHEDVADWTGAENLIRQAVETYGSLDILVNNAGNSRPRMSFNMSEEEWDGVIRVHLKGTFAPSRHAASHWHAQARASGRPVAAVIINTASTNGLNGGTPGHVNYSTAKSGICTMTTALARELAPYGIRCNAIAPLAYSNMTRSLWGTEQFPADHLPELEPENVAAVVAWLASPLSEPLTGQVFAVLGSRCEVWRGWERSTTITTTGPWTFSTIAANGPTLISVAEPS